MSIDFNDATDGDTNNHMNLVKWCEQTQSKIIVGGTLLSQADGKTSTNAQSKTHENQFDVINKSDAKQLARSINDSLITAMMQLNYPNITPDRYPKFWFDTSDTEDLESFSKSLGEMVDTGMKIPLTWAHERAGIPMPAGDQEAILTRIQAPTPQLAMNSWQPHLLGNLLAANSAHIPLDEQAVQLQLRDQTKEAQQTAELWMHDLMAKINAGQDENEILAVLSEIYPADDEPVLQEKLTQLIFAAEVFGRLSAQADAENG